MTLCISGTCSYVNVIKQYLTLLLWQIKIDYLLVKLTFLIGWDYLIQIQIAHFWLLIIRKVMNLICHEMLARFLWSMLTNMMLTANITSLYLDKSSLEMYTLLMSTFISFPVWSLFSLIQCLGPIYVRLLLHPYTCKQKYKSMMGWYQQWALHQYNCHQLTILTNNAA